MYEAETRVKELMKELTDFKCAVCLNETKQDWRNGFSSVSKAAGGDPLHVKDSRSCRLRWPQEIRFSFSSLSDPHGFYLGQTESGGPVLFDLFYKNKKYEFHMIFCA